MSCACFILPIGIVLPLVYVLLVFLRQQIPVIAVEREGSGAEAVTGGFKMRGNS